MAPSYCVFNLCAENHLIHTLIGTFVESDAIPDCTGDDLLAFISQFHQKNVSFTGGVNINFMRSLMRMLERAPLLITEPTSLVHSSSLPLTIIQTGLLPIATKSLFTVVPPLTDDSGCTVLSEESHGGLIFIPETVDYKLFNLEINEFIQTMFRIKHTLEMMVGGEKDKLKERLIFHSIREFLKNNSLCNRMEQAIRNRLTVKVGDDVNTLRILYHIVDQHWLPAIVNTPFAESLSNESIILKTVTLLEKFKDAFVNMPNAPDDETLMTAVRKSRDITELVTLVANQYRELKVPSIGEIIEAETSQVEPGRKMTVRLTPP